MNHPRLLTGIIALGWALTVSVQAGSPEELRFDNVNYRTKGLYRSGSGEFLQIEYFQVGQTSTTAAKSVEFRRQPLSTDRLDELIEVHLQTLDQWKPKGVLTVLEKSDRHLVLKDVRFDGTLSGSPVFIIYFYELNGRTLLTSQVIFRPRPPFDTAEAFSKEFTTKEATWLKDLRQASRRVQESLAREANKGGATNRSRPIGSETNRTSAAAGSGG